MPEHLKLDLGGKVVYFLKVCNTTTERSNSILSEENEIENQGRSERNN